MIKCQSLLYNKSVNCTKVCKTNATMMKTPILLICFNRPNYVRKVVESISRAAPETLFVFQDGARNESDLKKCVEVRRVIENEINWSCDLHLFYSDKNLGCGPGPATAISWFFSFVDKGIILEDDAVPHPDFYPYASELLNRFNDDDSVFAIGSMNVDAHSWGNGSYYFSRMNRNLCAWATWRRAWMKFDIQMKGISRNHLNHALKYYHCGLLEREYWCDRLVEVHKDGCRGMSWDMQFFMSIWINQGKGIIPNVNLSSNIGTVGEATHAMVAGNIIDNVPTHSILPLIHPQKEDIQFEADRQFHFLYFEPGKKNWSSLQILYYFINKRIKRLLGHQGPWIKRKS